MVVPGRQRPSSILKQTKPWLPALSEEVWSNLEIRDNILSFCEQPTLHSLLTASDKATLPLVIPHLYRSVAEDQVVDLEFLTGVSDERYLWYTKAIIEMEAYEGDLLDPLEREEVLDVYPNLTTCKFYTESVDPSAYGQSNSSMWLSAELKEGGPGSGGRLCGLYLEVDEVESLPSALSIIESLQTRDRSEIKLRGIDFGWAMDAPTARDQASTVTANPLFTDGWFSPPRIELWNPQGLNRFQYLFQPLPKGTITTMLAHMPNLRTLALLDAGGERCAIEFLRQIRSACPCLEDLKWFIADSTDLPFERLDPALDEFPTLKSLQAPWFTEFRLSGRQLAAKKAALQTRVLPRTVFPALEHLEIDLAIDMTFDTAHHLEAAWCLATVIPPTCCLKLASAEWVGPKMTYLGSEGSNGTTAKIWGFNMIGTWHSLIDSIKLARDPGWRQLPHALPTTQSSKIRFNPDSEVVEFLKDQEPLRVGVDSPRRQVESKAYMTRDESRVLRKLILVAEGNDSEDDEDMDGFENGFFGKDGGGNDGRPKGLRV